MHAVLVSVTINDPDAATTRLRNEIVPQVKGAPGFVAGYWTRVDGEGRGTMIFESEDAAQGVANMIQEQPESNEVTVNSIDVGEVVEHA